MKNLPREQTEFLLQWAKTCQSSQNIEIRFNLHWYTDDKEAFIQYGNLKVNIDYNSKDEWLNTLISLDHNGWITITQNHDAVRRDYNCNVVSKEAVNNIIHTLNHK